MRGVSKFARGGTFFLRVGPFLSNNFPGRGAIIGPQKLVAFVGAKYQARGIVFEGGFPQGKAPEHLSGVGFQCIKGRGIHVITPNVTAC